MCDKSTNFQSLATFKAVVTTHLQVYTWMLVKFVALEPLASPAVAIKPICTTKFATIPYLTDVE